MMKARDLKNSILQLAVEGKLVPQNPNDEPASMLLERIREQKRQLIAEGKAKFPRGGESVIFIGSDGLPYEKRVDAKGRESEPICIADEVPFEIPKSWKWVRLENVCQKIVDCPHSTPQYLTAETGYVAIDTNCIDDDWHLTGTRNLSKESYEIRVSRYVPQVGDLIFTREGSIGRSLIINRNRVCLGQRVMLMSTFQDALMSTYCQLVLSSPYAWTLYKAAHVGTGVKHINVVMVKALLVPPPLAEQRRIVAKVSELMPLVKGYGELEEEREELDTKLPEALRKSVLQQAVEGRLVPQDPSDEPASILLNRIRAARRELVADGKLKFPRGGESVIFRGSDGRRYEKRVDKNGRESEPVCIEDEIPFEIPESWEWARLGSLILNRAQKKPDTTFCYIDISSIDNRHQSLSRENTVIEASKAPSRARKPVEGGDILYSTVRPYLHNTCIIDRTFPLPPIASTGFAAMVCPEGLFNKYVLAYLLSPWFDSYANANENAKGVAYPAINDTRLYGALVPLPPLAEQHRIVELSRELFGATG